MKTKRFQLYKSGFYKLHMRVNGRKEIMKLVTTLIGSINATSFVGQSNLELRLDNGCSGYRSKKTCRVESVIGNVVVC